MSTRSIFDNKVLNLRLIHTHDIEVNWNNCDVVIKAGELIVYDSEIDKDGNNLRLPAGRTTPYTFARFKIGDGIHLPRELPFATNKAVETFFNITNNTVIIDGGRITTYDVNI